MPFSLISTWQFSYPNPTYSYDVQQHSSLLFPVPSAIWFRLDANFDANLLKILFLAAHFFYACLCMCMYIMSFQLSNIYLYMHRAYFKKSLQLQRTEKFETYKHFKISCKKIFHFPKFPTTFFSFTKIFSISSTKNSDDVFFSHFISYVSALPNAAGTTAQTYFLHHSFSKFHAFQHSFLRFSTVPVPNLQLQLHNSHFTTANYILQLHRLSSVAS